MSKHTPGPWTAEGDRISDARDRRVATSYFTGDAHLIAAAPDMYEALQRTLAYLNGEDDADDMAEISERIEDALAKARGEINEAQSDSPIPTDRAYTDKDTQDV